MNKFIFLLMMGMFVLVACKQEMTSTLYVGDIVDVASNNTPLTAAAAIKLEMSSRACAAVKSGTVYYFIIFNLLLS